MYSQILEILALIGVVLIITRGKILDRLKDHLPDKLRELLDCAMCSGWWIGYFYGFYNSQVLDISGIWDIGVYNFKFAFTVSALSYLYVKLTDALDSWG